jgi:hypothetical protein
LLEARLIAMYPSADRQLPSQLQGAHDISDILDVFGRG